MPWLERRPIKGEIGEYIVMARQTSDRTWLVDAATNEFSREQAIPLSFLKKGRYKALIIQDRNDADYRMPTESYKVSKSFVGKGRHFACYTCTRRGACIII
ncbi:glycoside hydrolase family 97 C-terminal domain-containing protein [Mucilaginibacter sp. JRF]|nr:glycoside hydrolase family 97 C-terminal domain-containing protein [Mucilaginibacter sp. JRF]